MQNGKVYHTHIAAIYNACPIRQKLVYCPFLTISKKVAAYEYLGTIDIQKLQSNTDEIEKNQNDNIS